MDIMQSLFYYDKYASFLFAHFKKNIGWMKWDQTKCIIIIYDYNIFAKKIKESIFCHFSAFLNAK